MREIGALLRWRVFVNPEYYEGTRLLRIPDLRERR
jgi:hypothetical protein